MNTDKPICSVCQSTEIEELFEAPDFWVTKEMFTISRCIKCGFAYTKNAPDAANIGKYYQHADYVSHTDTQQGLFFKIYHFVRETMLGKKRQMIEKHVVKGNLLDIGAGTGYFLNHMQQNSWQVSGVEPDTGAADIAQQKFGLKLEQTLQETVNNGQSFQAISMWHVLEHVHELNQYFDFFKTLLAPNGKLFIAVPNHTSFDAQYYKQNWAAWDVPKHLWHFSPKSMQILAEKNGFMIEQKYMLPFDSFYISIMSEKIKGSSKLAIIRAAFVGFVSYVKALLNVEKASSVVYVISSMPTFNENK